MSLKMTSQHRRHGHRMSHWFLPLSEPHTATIGLLAFEIVHMQSKSLTAYFTFYMFVYFGELGKTIVTSVMKSDVYTAVDCAEDFYTTLHEQLHLRVKTAKLL